MINRRNLLAASVVSAGFIASSSRSSFAQTPEATLQLTNATFVDAAINGIDLAPSGAGNDMRGYILGDPDAPNTLEIYSDYRCPHCRVFHNDMEGKLITDFVEQGVLNLELMDFTVVGVPSLEQLNIDVLESVQAAEAAACAAEQGAYMEYRAWLFEGGPQLQIGDLADSKLIMAALDMDLDVEKFIRSLATGKFEEGVIAMVHVGIDRSVQGTPTMMMNGGDPFYSPPEGYDALKKIIEDQLK